MSKKINDEYGERMKSYEDIRRLDPHLPVYARIDGRGFSKFTRGMVKPFDSRMMNIMIKVTDYLVEKTNACIGHTQSDEISLIWLAREEKSDIFFSGKVQKMASVLASMTAAKFASLMDYHNLGNFKNRLPHFDARVMQLPSWTEAANMLLWRAMDARKNTIQAIAQSEFSPKQLHKKSQAEMLSMLAVRDISLDSYAFYALEGSFRQRNTYIINSKDGPVERHRVEAFEMPPFNKVINREAVIFDGDAPQMSGEIQ